MWKRNSTQAQTSTRLFSLQLANHDSLFSPQHKRRFKFRSFRTFLIFAAALTALVFPSFKLGRPNLQNPSVDLPDSLELGELFTVPANEKENMVPLISGRPLGFVDGKTPLYVGAAVKPFGFEINFDLSNNDPYAKLKSLLPRLEHPTFPVLVKRVRIHGAKTLVAEEKPNPRETFKPIPPPPISPEEASAYERYDGKMRLRCWRAPLVEPLAIDPLKPRRNQRLGKVSSAGPGEVVYTSPKEAGERVVVIYHGGGLFSRYWGIKDLKLPKDGRLTTGQTIGHVALAPPRQTTPVYWQPIMNGAGGPGEINREALLDLSSQLCDSK